MYIKNANGTVFEGTQEQLNSYAIYGSRQATKQEVKEYFGGTITEIEDENIVTVEATEQAPVEDSPDIDLAPVITNDEPPLTEEVKTVQDDNTDTVLTTGETPPVAPKEKPLSKMVRAELVAKLLEVNPDFPALESATNAQIKQEIEQALVELVKVESTDETPPADGDKYETK
jgi:hypothetical protein